MLARFAAFSLVLTACAEPLDEMSLDFTAEPLDAAEVREWSVAKAEGGFHRITVRRTLPEPDTCQSVKGDLATSGGDIMLRVTSQSTRECPPSAALYGYTAIIEGVPAGRYNLKVIHLRAGESGRGEVVMRQPIHVR